MNCCINVTMLLYYNNIASLQQVAKKMVNVFCSFSRVMGFGIPVFNHNPGPCKLFHGIVMLLYYK